MAIVDGDKLMTIITTPEFNTNEKVEISLKNTEFLQKNSGLLQEAPGKIARFKRVTSLLNSLWETEWSPEILRRISVLRKVNRKNVDKALAHLNED